MEITQAEIDINEYDGSMSKAGWGREPHPVCLGNPVGLLFGGNMTPEIWYRRTIGKRIDTDNYPRTNPYQCWDYYDYFCRVIECTASRYCAITGYVGDLWKLRYKYGFDKWFIFVEPSEIQEGDWLFWDKHVAFYYNGLEVGQNQNGKPWVTDMTLNRRGLLGAMRYKHWDKPKTGTAECYSKIIAGTYKTTDYVNLRTGGSTDYPVITTLPKNP